ncbi:hypothetical protein IFR05_014144 [Cadophora sp. M221]|nr:hypothetical protein IFR05_014144 [Cadophora sp. M221]
MIGVYKNSGINIAASGAEDGTVGCFFEGSVDCEIETYAMGSFLCHTRPDVQELIDTLDSMPLLQRGWVVQERIISPRNLHFAKSQVFWECESLRACQMVPYRYKLTPTDLARRDFLDIQDPGNIKAHLRIWHEIVENYSRCALTKATDKLIAIAGLARLFREQTGYEYSAGAFGPKPRPSSYRAPSWSWAAVDGFINLSHNTPSHMFIEVRDLKFENATKGDAFTDILSATLSIKCKCILKCGIKITRSEEGPKGEASFPNHTLQCWGGFDVIEEYDSPPLDDPLMENYLLPMTDDHTSKYKEVSPLGESDASRCICLIIKPTAETQG